MQNNKIQSFSNLQKFEDALKEKASFMLSSFHRQRTRFGDVWEEELNTLLGAITADNKDKLHAAVEGYIEFALDGMRLQKRFEKTGEYEKKTYDEAAEEVYLNKPYMFSYYLPGILLSHYLWPHHYSQLQFFRSSFLPLFHAANTQSFCDIGVGTGFYSRLLLTASERAEGNACDISEAAIEYSIGHLQAFNVAVRWAPEIRNVITNPTQKKWPFILSVEVLEHLTDPLLFLEALYNMLEPGGFAFITAAVTAANKDHIYLYHSPADVQRQLEQVGFIVVKWQADKAYEPKDKEPVPINAAYILSKA